MPQHAAAALWSALCCGEGPASALPSMVFLSATAACVVHLLGAGYAFRRIGSRFLLREIVLGLLINHSLTTWLWLLSILEHVTTALCSQRTADGQFQMEQLMEGNDFQQLLASLLQPKLLKMVVCSVVSMVPVYFLTELTDNTRSGFFVWVHGPRWQRTEMGASTYFLARPPAADLPASSSRPPQPRSMTALHSKATGRRTPRTRATRSV